VPEQRSATFLNIGTPFQYFLLIQLFFSLNVFVNSVAGCNLELKIHQNVFAARASPQTPPGELTVLPQTPCLALRGLLHDRGWKEKGKEGKGRGEAAFPLLFYNLTTAGNMNDHAC